jgi:D-lactate dehydrogenase (cytochrome)
MVLTSIETSKREIDALGVFAGIIGHIGDRNFHGIILHDKNDADEQKRVEQCVHNMVERALEMDGSCTVSFPRCITVRGY